MHWNCIQYGLILIEFESNSYLVLHKTNIYSFDLHYAQQCCCVSLITISSFQEFEAFIIAYRETLSLNKGIQQQLVNSNGSDLKYVSVAYIERLANNLLMK